MSGPFIKIDLHGMNQDQAMMKDECIICNAPLEYLEEDILMECALCHKKELSKTRCGF